MYVAFDDWTRGRSIVSLGTNAGAEQLPFQNWRNFKEAYAPELVDYAIRESAIPVRCTLDPFGGSGTTALACQFLGVVPTTVEVNPFLADLIEAKLCQYNADALARDLGLIAHRALDKSELSPRLASLPPTFVEPGVNDRWIFDRSIALRIGALLDAIESLELDTHRRLFRVLLGGVLIDVSNVVVSGKGRRYRRGWQSRSRSANNVDDAFFAAARNAIGDIHRYANRRERTYDLIRGDARQAISGGRWDLALFSPPYPNSFDYTDVYNVELWVLGYLSSPISNRTLREATLSSHVQVSRSFAPPPSNSVLLDNVMIQLIEARAKLWDARIPEMVGAYFADLMGIIQQIGKGLAPQGSLWLVVGDSQYAGIPIPTSKIIGGLAQATGWRLRGYEPFRSMRLSAQQGGRPELAETLIMLERAH